MRTPVKNLSEHLNDQKIDASLFNKLSRNMSTLNSKFEDMNSKFESLTVSYASALQQMNENNLKALEEAKKLNKELDKVKNSSNTGGFVEGFLEDSYLNEAFKNREVLFQTSITETLLILLFILLFISNISSDKVKEQEQIIDFQEEKLDYVESIVDSSGVDLDSLIFYKESYTFYNNENIVLNDFLGSLADGEKIEDIYEKVIKENASLKEKIGQLKN